jgi:Zn-dependent peptidase ImmA (M78 family)
LQKYEKGRAMPNSTVLLAVAEACSLRPDYFFQPRPVVLEGIEFRKRAKFGKKKQEQVQEQARDFFERYLEVEAALGIETLPLPRSDLRQAPDSDLPELAEKAAEKVRNDWRLGLGPLPNVHELLEDNGVKVKEVEAEEDFNGLSGWANNTTPIIVLASWLNDYLPRKRLTELHELGHLSMRLSEDLDKKRKESLCFRFAGAMLIPRERFTEEFGRKRKFGRVSLQELIAIKEQWGISIGAIMKRAEQLGLILPATYRQFCIDYNRRGFRQNEPGEWIGSDSASRFRQLVHRAAAQELITRSKAAGLLGVTLREFDRQFGDAE